MPRGIAEVDWAAAEEVLTSSREVIEKTPSSVVTPEGSGKKQPVLTGSTAPRRWPPESNGLDGRLSTSATGFRKGAAKRP